MICVIPKHSGYSADSRRLYFKGGGGSQTTVQEIPKELKDLATAYSDKAMDLADQDFNPYGGIRFAGFTGNQNAAFNAIRQRAFGGDDTIDAGSSFLQNQLNSGPSSATKNPYGNVSGGSNPYAGQNQYLQENIDAALGDVARNYNQTVKPGQATANAESGSFGNAGLAQVQAMQENDLQKTMGGIASGMRMQDYGMQQQLAESGLNRDLGAQQFNATMGGDWAARNDATKQNWATNNLNATGQALGYGNQAYTDAQQLMNVGQMQQDQSQQGLDFNYQQYQDKLNLPYKQLAAMSGVFGSYPGGSSTTTGGGGK